MQTHTNRYEWAHSPDEKNIRATAGLKISAGDAHKMWQRSRRRAPEGLRDQFDIGSFKRLITGRVRTVSDDARANVNFLVMPGKGIRDSARRSLHVNPLRGAKRANRRYVSQYLGDLRFSIRDHGRQELLKREIGNIASAIRPFPGKRP